jgi:hypothetical protein
MTQSSLLSVSWEEQREGIDAIVISRKSYTKKRARCLILYCCCVITLSFLVFNITGTSQSVKIACEEAMKSKSLSERQKEKKTTLRARQIMLQ